MRICSAGTNQDGSELWEALFVNFQCVKHALAESNLSCGFRSNDVAQPLWWA